MFVIIQFSDADKPAVQDVIQAGYTQIPENTDEFVESVDIAI